jgi:hypothetical protein
MKDWAAFNSLFMKIVRSEVFASALLFTLLLIGMNSRFFANAQGYKPVKVEKPVIIFEKKPCFGFCPVYEAKFFANGNVLVTYTKAQEKPQKIKFKISKAEIKSLVERADDLNVFQMKDKYETLMTDFQVRELTVNKQFKSKTISYTEGASTEFESYLTDLAKLVESNINVDFRPSGK